MKMQGIPYIGVTGFMSDFEVNQVLRAFGHQSFRERIFQVGVLVSSKTMNNIPNRWPNRYPKIEQIKNIFNCSMTENLIHFNTDFPENLCEDMIKLSDISLAGSYFRGFQLNIAWPDIRQIELFRNHDRHSRIVLQIGKKAMSQCENSCCPDKDIAAKIWQYQDLIDDILLDPSGGMGEEIDINKMRNYLYSIKDLNSDIGLGIAGGLCAQNLRTILPNIVSEFPDLNIDAEGRLRKPDDDSLNLDAAEEYVREAIRLF
jgi:hypothetical protein